MRSTRRSRAGAVFDAPLVSAATTAYPSIADRANGGTSIGDTTSAAATRPAAASSGTRSTRVIGRTEASSRRRAARQRDDDAARRKAGACTAHHRRGANLLEAQHPEEFPEAVEALVQEAADRFIRAVAGSDAGS